MGDTVGEIENGLTVAEEILPALFGALSMFFPQLAMFTKFLPLLPVLVKAVDTVGTATGRPVHEAIAIVQSHLTPGEANAPALDAQAATPGG
jgi:hypothetical protein